MAIDSEIASEFAALGVHIEVDETDDDADAIPVWDVNRDAVWLFLDLETQWRALATLRNLIWLGLDYVAAGELMRARGWRRKQRARLFEDLQVMERAALDTFASLEAGDGA